VEGVERERLADEARRVPACVGTEHRRSRTPEAHTAVARPPTRTTRASVRSTRHRTRARIAGASADSTDASTRRSRRRARRGDRSRLWPSRCVTVPRRVVEGVDVVVPRRLRRPLGHRAANALGEVEGWATSWKSLGVRTSAKYRPTWSQSTSQRSERGPSASARHSSPIHPRTSHYLPFRLSRSDRLRRRWGRVLLVRSTHSTVRRGLTVALMMSMAALCGSSVGIDALTQPGDEGVSHDDRRTWLSPFAAHEDRRARRVVERMAQARPLASGVLAGCATNHLRSMPHSGQEDHRGDGGAPGATDAPDGRRSLPPVSAPVLA